MMLFKLQLSYILMSIVQRYLFLLKKIKKSPPSYFQEYSKLNINATKKLKTKDFQEQLMQIDPNIILNRINELQQQFMPKKTKNKMQESNVDTARQSEHVIPYTIPESILTLKKYIEIIHVKSINYYSHLHQKSLALTLIGEMPASIVNSQRKVSINARQIQENPHKSINWLFKARQEFFVEPLLQNLQHRKTRDDNIKFILGQLTQESLTTKLYSPKFNLIQNYKHPNYNYSKANQLLLAYDLFKEKEFNSEVFHYLQIWDKITIQLKRQKLMESIVFKFIPYKSYCVSYFQHSSSSKILKIFSTFIRVVNAQSFPFFSKSKTVLHFVDIILSTKHFAKGDVQSIKENQYQIYTIILQLISEFISNLETTRLLKVQLDLFLEVIELFQGIKEKILSLFTEKQLSQSKIADIDLNRLKSQLTMLQQFEWPLHLTEQLDELLPNYNQKNKNVHTHQIPNIKLYKRFIHFIIKEDIQVGNSSAEILVQFIQKTIKKHQKQACEALNTSEAEEDDNIFVSELRYVFTAQFNKDLIVFLFNSQLSPQAQTQLTSTINYLWMFIRSQSVQSRESIKEFLLFFNILVKYGKNALNQQHKVEFYEMLVKCIKNIFQINFQELINAEIANFMIESSKEIFNGAHSLQIQTQIKVLYGLS